MTLYRLTGEPVPSAAPVLVMAFDAWVDAGGAATAAATRLATDGEVVATFDSDALLDYRARRPILDIIDGESTTLAWQEISIRRARAGSVDLLVLTGPEPDLRWREFASSVLDIALRFGVIRTVALGAIPAAVAHSRPVSLLATATPRDQLGPDDRRPEGLLRVPAAALSVVQKTLADHGIPTAGFYAQIPHYVTAPYSAGAIALLERLSGFLGFPLELGSLPDEARQQRAALDAIIAERPDVAAYVERLESLAPEENLAPGSRLPSADEIAAEVERFLRDAE